MTSAILTTDTFPASISACNYDKIQNSSMLQVNAHSSHAMEARQKLYNSSFRKPQGPSCLRSLSYSVIFSAIFWVFDDITYS
jgi:hypothetical protein